MGDKGVVAVVGDDMGEGMQCSDHPYRSNPGGICAFCLQEKLGKLVSSKSNPFSPLPPPPSSSSSSPSFRSDFGGTIATSGSTGVRAKIPFLSANNPKKKKKKSSPKHNNGTGSDGGKVMTATTTSSAAINSHNGLVLKRSKSVAPRPAGEGSVGGVAADAMDSPRKKSFWSFLYLSSSSSSSTTTASSSASNKRRSTSSSALGGGGGRIVKQQQAMEVSQSISSNQLDSKKEEKKKDHHQHAGGEGDHQDVVESPSGSQASSSFGRKVARSRSVGCGSRSFSGDFLERISNGFGDCTLRRVESQREAKPNNNHKMVLHHHHHHQGDNIEEQRIKERVKCGGIFGGFGMVSSSSSSYWISAAAAADHDLDSTTSRVSSSSSSSITRGRAAAVTPQRSRSWAWAAFASPMRAFRPAASSSSSTSTRSYAITAVSTSINGSNSIINGGSSRSSKLSSSTPSLLAVSG